MTTDISEKGLESNTRRAMTGRVSCALCIFMDCVSHARPFNAWND